MLEYILDFDRQYKKVEKHGMKLPDSVQAFKLLKGANIQTNERRMILSNCTKLEYEIVKSALRRTYGDTVVKEDNNVTIKEEAAFSTSNPKQQKSRPKRCGNGTNPMGKDGNITRCARCGSTYHWVKDCPVKESNKNSTMSTTTDDEVTSANVSVAYAELTDVLL